MEVFEFGDFKLDCDRFELSRAGRTLKLERKPLELLILLAGRKGDLVTRTEIAERLWEREVFVDTEHGINTAVRKVRQLLRDDPDHPRFVQTVSGKGYRFIAEIAFPVNGVEVRAGEAASKEIVNGVAADPAKQGAREAVRKRPTWLTIAGICVALALVATALVFLLRVHPARLQYTQLTDFTDSAMAPALSPDGRMVAFIRGDSSFLTADQIYVKMLPDGEPKQVTDDPRLKYGVAFSPDESQIAYSVLEPHVFSTYTVSVLGGDSHLFLNNAAGLTWLDQRQLLFSQIRSGLHLGVVTGTAARENFRELYFPPHERAMAHYSYASPDRKSALVVEMNELGWWTTCRLISLDGRVPGRPVGPEGACTSAGWSPDGSRMYFTAFVDGRSHLWRQRFPNGQPEQVTFGPTEEEGVAVEHDGRSVITSMGVHESAIWIHDPTGERPLSSEGEVFAITSPPSFSADDTILYYLLLRPSTSSGPELWRMTIASGKSEAVFPGVSMLAYDVSPDGKQVVYSNPGHDGKSQLWLAPVDRSSPARRIGNSGETSPHFGPRGQILFQVVEGNFNFLEQMNPDGSGRSKVVSYPVNAINGISPGRQWIMGDALLPGRTGSPAPVAIPTGGGPPRIVCAIYCVPTWSSNGKWLFIPVEEPSRTNPGRSLVIPVGPAESLPELPPGGIKPFANASVVPGSVSVNRAELVPGKDPAHFAYVNTTVHRNLYRISLP